MESESNPQKFSLHLLDRALAKGRERREQERQELLAAAFQALNRLAGEISFQEAYIFGSLTAPYRFHPDADVDVGFIGLKDEDFFSTMSFLSQQLGMEVDILQLEDHRLKERVIQKGIRWKRGG